MAGQDIVRTTVFLDQLPATKNRKTVFPGHLRRMDSGLPLHYLDFTENRLGIFGGVYLP